MPGFPPAHFPASEGSARPHHRAHAHSPLPPLFWPHPPKQGQRPNTRPSLDARTPARPPACRPPHLAHAGSSPTLYVSNIPSSALLSSAPKESRIAPPCTSRAPASLCITSPQLPSSSATRCHCHLTSPVRLSLPCASPHLTLHCIKGRLLTLTRLFRLILLSLTESLCSGSGVQSGEAKRLSVSAIQCRRSRKSTSSSCRIQVQQRRLSQARCALKRGDFPALTPPARQMLPSSTPTVSSL